MNTSSAIALGKRLRLERIQHNWRQQDLADQLETTVVTIKRWERGSQQPSIYFRVRLCALFGKSAEELGFVFDGEPIAYLAVDEIPVWSVPFPRNPFFTGRQFLLEHLSQIMENKSASAALTRSYALHGLGGIGKTQFAVEYAHRYRGKYKAVLWVDAETQAALASSFVRLATALALPEHLEEDQSKIVAATLRWFNQHEGWLLIFDNVEDLSLVKPFLPTSDRGTLLLTTRLQSLGIVAQRIDLYPLDQQEGPAFLFNRIRHFFQRGAPQPIKPEELAVAQAIVTEMGGLPLALEQAGAYIAATQCRLQDYLRLFQMRQHRLLSEHEPASDHPLSVSQTFTLAFEKVQQRNALAATLLTVCAFLAPEAIPESLFQEGAATPGSLFEVIASNPLAFPEAIKVLLSYSLLQRNAVTRTLTIHRLVQVVLREQLTLEEQRGWRQRVLEMISLVFPNDEHTQADYWSSGEQLLTHAQVCLAPENQWPDNEEFRVPLMNRVAIYLARHARYDEAEPLFKQAIQLGKQALGASHPLVAEGLSGLGHQRMEQGKHSESEFLLTQALAIREQVLGEQHPLVGHTLDMLGSSYFHLAKYEQAEQVLLRALQINEQALGPDHPQVASPCISLGKLYLEQGKYEQAETVYQRALHIREQALGPEHSMTAASLNNLGTLYASQGKYEQAEILLLRAFQIQEVLLGSEHPRLAFSLNNLGGIYFLQGKYKQTEQVLLQALYMRERALGPEHPELGLALNNLGGLYAEQGKYEQAEPMFLRALHVQEQTLGPEHPELALTLDNLGELYFLQKKYEQAQFLYQRTLQIREQAFGPDHPHITITLNNMGAFFVQQGKYEQAEPLFQRTLSIVERVLGPEHQEMAKPLHGLANIYREQGEYEQAETLYHRVLHLLQQHLSAEHPYIGDTLHDFARLRHLQQQLEEAHTYYQQALAIREQALGFFHPKTQETRDALAQLMQEMQTASEF